MKEPFWLSRLHVEAIHDEQLAEHGGLAGLGSPDALESAVARPQNLFLHEKCDLVDLAAAYAHGIIKNHPFNDGNKRAAFATAVVFLDLNGLELTMSEPQATLAVLQLADGSLTQTDFAKLLREHTKKG